MNVIFFYICHWHIYTKPPYARLGPFSPNNLFMTFLRLGEYFTGYTCCNVVEGLLGRLRAPYLIAWVFNPSFPKPKKKNIPTITKI
jgi:hypothetical protein